MTPWGWTGPVRGMLIGVAAVTGSILAWASPDRPPTPVPVASLVVDANAAPDVVLGALPGIGPVLAGRIVEARPFRSLDDLDRRVKGIGPAKVAAIRPFLRFSEPERSPNSLP